jgi:hypothetical protein
MFSRTDSGLFLGVCDEALAADRLGGILSIAANPVH